MSTAQHNPVNFLITALFTAMLVLAGCGQGFTVAVNNQAVFDPEGRLLGGETIDADLQGCINHAMAQQGLQIPAELTVLSCAGSDIGNLENIGQLQRLRFLDLGNNAISNITPLEDLPALSGLNLSNNAITDIGPLFNMPALTTVDLSGNERIPCTQLNRLRERLGENLTPPTRCRN
ncbi:MAG: leucine-rich repeat domain-containing protein [Pseudohongiellaceae bacterium]